MGLIGFIVLIGFFGFIGLLGFRAQSLRLARLTIHSTKQEKALACACFVAISLGRSNTWLRIASGRGSGLDAQKILQFL